MSRTTIASQNLALVFVLLVVIGGLIGASSLDLKISTVGAILVLVAAVEAAVILAGITLLQRRQLAKAEALDPVIVRGKP